MLARVSQALSQFIKPIATSRPEATAGGKKGFERTQMPDTADRGGSGFQRFSKEGEKPPLAEVIPLEREKLPGNPAPSPDSLPATQRVSISVPEAFVLFYRQFSEHKLKLAKWLGWRVYRAAGAHSNTRKYRKGSMLDRHAG